MENLYKLLADLHRPCERQGPGSVETSRLAMRLAGLEQAKGLKIADVGCGTGASALLRRAMPGTACDAPAQAAFLSCHAFIISYPPFPRLVF